MSGQALRIFLLSSLAQIMKAFMGRLMCWLPSRSRLDWRMILAPNNLAAEAGGGGGEKKARKKLDLDREIGLSLSLLSATLGSKFVMTCHLFLSLFPSPTEAS